MLVRRDLGFPSLVFLAVVVVVPVIVLIIRRKWRHSVARREEIKRLVVWAAEESARAEFEAREAYYYPATGTPARVSVSSPISVPISVSVPLGSPLKPQYQCAVCFRPTTLRCSNCKTVRYCTKRCQTIHWIQVHKYECCPSNDVVGRGDEGDKTEAQQTCTSYPNQADVGVGAESLAGGHTVLSTPTPTPTPNPTITPTKYSAAGERKPTGLGKKSQNQSDEETKNGCMESEPCCSGFWDGAIDNNKKKLVMDDNAAGSEEAHYATKKKCEKVMDDKTVGGLFDVSSNKSVISQSPKFKEEALSTSSSSSKTRAPDTSSRHASKSNTSTKPVKLVYHTSSHQLTEVSRLRSGSKTSKSKVVDKSSEGGSHKYAFKGLFPYEMFVKLYTSKKMELQPFGLKNCGNSCYANAVLQCLIYTPPLTAFFLERLHSRACDKRGWCFTCELEGLVIKAKDGNSPLLSPIRILTHIENIGSNLGHGKQEDAHEFLRYVIDALQVVCIKEAGTTALNSAEEETTLVGLTFGGHLRSKIICIKCGGKSERHERMMDLSVEIQGGDIATLEEALDKFTCTEILDGENKYKCSRCKSYEKARKKMTLLEAPNVLTIALKRFQSGKYGKLNKSIEFPEILDLAPYVSGTSDKSPVYRLYGVVVHVDTNTNTNTMMNDASSGHYVCYVKNADNRWFKFNDSMVNEVDVQHVLAKGAYMLFYARCSPRAPRSIRDSLIQNQDAQKQKTVSRCGEEEAWNYRHRSVEEESSSSSDNNSGFFSESSCSCSTESSTHDHIPGDWEHDYWNNMITSSDSDTSSTSSFPSPLYSRLSHLYNTTSRTTDKECRNLDCSSSTSCSCSSKTNFDRLALGVGVSTPFRRPPAARGKLD